MKKIIANKRSLAEQEKAAMEEFMTKCENFKKQRLTYIQDLNSQCEELENQTNTCVGQLKKSDKCVEEFMNHNQQISKNDFEQLDNHVNAGLLCIDKSVAKCSTLQIQLENQQQQQ